MLSVMPLATGLEGVSVAIVSREHGGRTVCRRRRYASFSPAAMLLACLFLTACPEPDPTDRRATSAARPAEADSPSCLEPTTFAERLGCGSPEGRRTLHGH